MTLRSIVGLLLGLVLQISLVLPAGAFVAPERCDMTGTCSCCEAGASCPCMTDTKGEQPADPVTPPARPLKVDAVVPPEVISLRSITIPDEGPRALPDLAPRSAVGYPGVGLSISFCRLVI